MQMNKKNEKRLMGSKRIFLLRYIFIEHDCIGADFSSG